MATPMTRWEFWGRRRSDSRSAKPLAHLFGRGGKGIAGFAVAFFAGEHMIRSAAHVVGPHAAVGIHVRIVTV